MSAQAVGGAVGHNPISIMIPCHRVMGADGSLTGYAAGMEVKKMLLELENRGTENKRPENRIQENRIQENRIPENRRPETGDVMK